MLVVELLLLAEQCQHPDQVSCGEILRWPSAVHCQEQHRSLSQSPERLDHCRQHLQVVFVLTEQGVVQLRPAQLCDAASVKCPPCISPTQYT